MSTSTMSKYSYNKKTNSELNQQYEEKLKKYRKLSYETNRKLSRLSHEELMIPLIYWHGPPKHKITAMYIQKSMRSGDIIITGSQNGEFIIWKPYNTIHHPPQYNQQKSNTFDNNNKWVPIAMTFSTNTSPIISILGSFQHKEQAAFMACHADGETVIFSVYGAGALKIGCGERPILKEGISGIYGYGLSNESYQYCVCTNFFNHNLHLIDLHKGKQINYNLNQNILPMCIIDITFFELQLSSHCAIIDERGKIATFIINENNNTIQPQLNFESRLKDKPINIGITFDNEYLCAISKNQFVLFANDPLRFISTSSCDECECNECDECDCEYWDGMIVLDKYLYGIIQSTHNRPFFILLWRNGSAYLTIYLVQGQHNNGNVLEAIIHLLIPPSAHNKWNVVTNDNKGNIFIGTLDCKIIKFSMDDIEQCINLQDLEEEKVINLHGKYVGCIQDAFMCEDNEDKDKDEDNDITTSCMNITALGCLLCIGYDNGEIYIYNISLGEALMEIHTQLSRVNALLLLCSDRTCDGVLFVGYESGYIEAFNCATGELIISSQCHTDSVTQIITFEQDYYVFSAGKDNAMCSFLVYSQLKISITPPSNEDEHNNSAIRINWYRGHPSAINNIYRNEWCLISDLVCCELITGEIYIWCVSTAQLERKFFKNKALLFNIDRRLFYHLKRNELPHLTSHEREMYDMTPYATYNCNILMLDIRILGDYINTNEDGNEEKNENEKKDINKLSDLLSLLLDYNQEFSEYWRLFLAEFNCLISDISPCYGYCGDFESQTLLFPIASRAGGRWRIQPKVTAIYMLSINTICMWLLQCAPSKKLPVCSRLVTFYHVMLPDKFVGFVEPSRNSMARYCLNSVQEIRAASRMLLHGIVQRMTNVMRKSLILKWKKRFCFNLSNKNKNKNQMFTANINSNNKVPLSVLLGAIVICIIHSLKRNIIEDIVCQSVIATLIAVLMEKYSIHTHSDMIKISLSCDYLGKVIISWFKYVDDVEYLLKTLLDLRNCDHLLLKKSASSALLQCGVAVPQSFIKTMGNEALIISIHTNTNNTNNTNTNNTNPSEDIDMEEIDTKRHEQALMCIINLVQKYPQVLLKHIPLLVSTIIRCLDPSAPRRRKALLSATTASLHVLVTKYPNVAFHQETQHFAIGTGPARDNCILIYDLRTTTRWKQLKGHRAAVTAIEFNYDGSYLISYSAYERPPTVKCWYIGSGGFFNSLLSLTYASGGGGSSRNHSLTSHSKCIKTCPMPPLDRLYPPIDHLQYTKLTWNNKVKGAVKLQRENQSVLFFTVLPK